MIGISVLVSGTVHANAHERSAHEHRHAASGPPHRSRSTTMWMCRIQTSVDSPRNAKPGNETYRIRNKRDAGHSHIFLRKRISRSGDTSIWSWSARHQKFVTCMHGISFYLPSIHYRTNRYRKFYNIHEYPAFGHTPNFKLTYLAFYKSVFGEIYVR